MKQNNNGFELSIDSVLGGQSPTYHQATEDQFLTSIAIDPGGTNQGELKKPSGVISPVSFSRFSDAGISASHITKWIVTTPKDQTVYTYTEGGAVSGYDGSNILSANDIDVTLSPVSGAGNGAAYYNNYVYFGAPTDINRYGPLDNSPALTSGFWTSYLSATALSSVTYPTSTNVIYPNHAMHLHVDNKLYFCDISGNGQGIINFIKTKKTTDEGDTNDGSTRAALKLPFGYRPFDIESYGNDLAIVASQVGTSTTVAQGKSALFLWDTFSTSFYRQVNIPGAITTATVNHNGDLYVWAGAIDTGYQVLRYSGGYSFELIEDFLESSPPMAGAVDTYANRLVWGGFGAYPTTHASVFAMGYQNPKLPPRALNNIATATTSGTNPIITALKFVQGNLAAKYPIIAWLAADGSPRVGLDKILLGTQKSYFRSRLFNVGKKFIIKHIRITLSTALASGVSIVPKIYVDNDSSSTSLTTINTTNYGTQRIVDLYASVRGEENFELELGFAGTTNVSVNLPIKIFGEYLES